VHLFEPNLAEWLKKENKVLLNGRMGLLNGKTYHPVIGISHRNEPIALGVFVY
jgi:hypothetical protein